MAILLLWNEVDALKRSICPMLKVNSNRSEISLRLKNSLRFIANTLQVSYGISQSETHSAAAFTSVNLTKVKSQTGVRFS